jgi:hydroxymethylbilane synthase
MAQATTVAHMLEAVHDGLDVEIVVVETVGDRRLDVPLHEIGGQGVFAKEVQLAVLEGRADLAVHSAKDLPSATPEGLVLAAIPERVDPADVLVGRSLAGLGPGALVATGSPRRKALLASLRPDLDFTELRGNMASRLARPGTDGIDAVVAARAALERLGLLGQVAERLDPEVITPQVAQGAIGVEAAMGTPAEALVRAIDDASAHRCVDAERSFLVTLGAGCTAPVGAWCTENVGELDLRGILFDEATSQLRRARHHGDDPMALGAAVARDVSGAVGG